MGEYVEVDPAAEGIRLTAGPGGRTWQLVLLCALAALFGIGLWVVIARPFLQRQPMPDGSFMVLEQVTAGKIHEFWKLNGWRAAVGAGLPPVLREKLGAGRTLHTSGSDSVVFWIQRRLKEPNRYYQILRATVVDDLGREAEGVARPVHTAVAPDETFMAWELSCFPPGAQSVRLRFYLRDMKSNLLHRVEFEGASLGRATGASWKPVSLPAVVEKGPTTVALTEFRTGVRDKYWKQPAAAAAPHFTTARLRILRDGSPAGKWEVLRARLEDRYGNVLIPERLETIPQKDGLFLAFPGALWGDPGGWKLQVELQQAAAFGSEDLWTVRDLSMPAPGELAPSTAATQRRGLLLQVLGVGAPGTLWPEGGPSSAEYPTLHARVSPSSSQLLLSLVRAWDERGRTLNRGGGASGTWSTFTDGWSTLPLAVSGEARRVNVTLALHRRETVEFIAQPAPP